MGITIEVEGLTKRFGETTAVDAVAFAMGEHEFFSLVGPSGCGKTTTLRCVAGLETADEGRIGIKGTVVYASGEGVDVPTHHRAIGMVFQNYAVWPHMSVFQNIAYPLKLTGASRSEQRQRVGRVLEMLGMEDLGDRKPSQLSGGQQQRVALGRALVGEPDVLLLDEPLSNLDAKLREHMRVELKRIQRETGIPILYVTHDQLEALSMSDRIAVMEGGRIHQVAAPHEIYERPATKFVLDFIGSVNYLPCELLDTGSDTIEVRVEGGGLLTLPRPDHVPEGREMLLAVRPEDMTLGRAASGSDLRATVELRSFLGNLCEYRVRHGGLELRVQTEKDELVAEGADVVVSVRRGFLLDRGSAEDPLARVS
ncbi:MAG: ABC transporter ATP-binding protein [Trueperaceae bacterium]|nr:ABC transporter ATP-binding protein [Trueperaceae bacterium]